MDPGRWQRVCEIFETARGLRGAAREALLESVPDVADDVRELLDHHEADTAVLGDASSAPEPETRIGEYEIERVLGAGGMATVFLATGPLGRVALKRLRPELCGEPLIVERFQREAQLGARIRHPNVVRTHGLLGPSCMLLEYVEGQTLDQVLARDGTLSEATCLRVAREITDALVAVHAAGAVHRDLKPSNVILDGEGRARLMDLGIALPLDDLLRLSRTGQFVGTVRYSAPEQLTSSKAQVDGRTDLYALGILLYELLTGRHPLPAGGLVSSLRAQLEHIPQPLGEVQPDATPFFAALVERLMAKAPEERPESAAELRGLLAAGDARL